MQRWREQFEELPQEAKGTPLPPAQSSDGRIALNSTDEDLSFFWTRKTWLEHIDDDFAFLNELEENVIRG